MSSVLSRVSMQCMQSETLYFYQFRQGRSDGVYRYIYTHKNQSTLKKIMWLFFSCDPGQIRYDICSRTVWDINVCFEIAMTS